MAKRRKPAVRYPCGFCGEETEETRSIECEVIDNVMDITANNSLVYSKY